MNKQAIKNLPEVEIPAPNTLKVFMPHSLTLMYSYSTCVGFAYKGDRTFTAASFSNTTARHLSSVFGSDKSERVPAEEFDKALETALAEVFPESE